MAASGGLQREGMGNRASGVARSRNPRPRCDVTHEG